MARRAGLVAAVVAGALVIGGVALVRSLGEDDDGQPEVTAREGCELLTVAVSSEKGRLMTDLAEDYNAAARGDAGECVTVRVQTAPSGDMEAALVDGFDPSLLPDGVDRPDVWSPASTMWLNLLRFDQQGADTPDTVPDDPASITSTPLVLAMPQPMAEALGWPDAPVGWTDVARLATDPAGWGSVGHPEWGAFTLGKTNPYVSTSGLAATIGQLVAATGKASDLTAADVDDPAVAAQLAAVESSVAHYGDTTLTFLSNLAEADRTGRGLSYISAVAVEEKSVVDYDAGIPSGNPDNPLGGTSTRDDAATPEVPLVAVHPAEGTLFSDNPFAVLDADWVTDGQRAGAADFESWLLEPDQQDRFGDAGFRVGDEPPSTLTDAGLAVADDTARRLTVPSGQLLDQARGVWTEQRKRARALLVIDVSGSMDEEATAPDGRTTTKMELAKTAARAAIAQLTDTDELGVWVFTTGLDGGRFYSELVPVSPVGDNRDRIDSAIAALAPLDGTPLYAVTEAAFDAMSELADPAYITGVVLLTDGVNEYDSGPSLDGLVADLERRARETHVRVFTVAYGEGADLGVLGQIAEATQARAYDATDAARIGRVFRDILSNF